MHFHYQNLNERGKRSRKPLGPLWQHGRAWLHLKKGEVKAEWVLLFTRSCGIDFEVGDEDCTAWSFSLRIPFLFAIYTTVALPWLPVPHDAEYEFQGRKIRPVRSRRFSLYLFEWSVRLALWERDNDWRPTDPWWMRGMSWDLRNVLGKMKHKVEKVESARVVTIPMPEGTYKASVELVRRTWWRRFGRKVSKLYWEANTLPRTSIPSPGKGENSWDQDDSGLCGWSAESRDGHDIEVVIAEGVRSVLRDRRRRGSLDWAPAAKAAA